MTDPRQGLERQVEAFDLTENERGWLEFIRLASGDTDPKPTLKRVQQLQKIFRDEE